MSNKITIDRSVLELVLDALQHGITEMNHRGCAIECMPMHHAVKALREALAQPAAQPAVPRAFEYKNPMTGHAILSYDDNADLRLLIAEKGYVKEPLYKSQPAAQQEPAGKPDAWINAQALKELRKPEMTWMPAWNRQSEANPIALYTRPAVPLTDEFLLSLWSGSDSPRPVLGKNKVLAFARAIEAAHKIGGAE
jgi:hypothetical protein